MLQVLLKQHLQKQLLLAGNPVVVPVLGQQCVFRQETTLLQVIAFHAWTCEALNAFRHAASMVKCVC